MASIAFRNRLGRRLGAFTNCRSLLTGARGLEIGGPSEIFGRAGIFPVYPLLACLDNCDFAGETIWHGEGPDGSAFVFDPDRPPGRRLVRDGTALEGIEDGAYDVVLSSHTIEHIANPLRALEEWRRVVGPRGLVVLVVPHLENTVDHRRPVTTLEHLEADHEQGMPETDTTHIREFIELADLSRTPELPSRETFEQRTLANVEHRAVHHHVFDTELVARMLDRAGFELIALEPALPFHIVAVARRCPAAPRNDGFISPSAPWRSTSVFRRDRARGQTRRS